MIEKNINEALVKKEPAARALITSLYQINEEDPFSEAAIYHHFPIYPHQSSESTISANVIFISKDHGVFIFQSVECSGRSELELDSYFDSLSEIDRLIFAKILKESPGLQKNRRSLKVEILPIVYLNNYDGGNLLNTEFDVITNLAQLVELIKETHNKDALCDNDYRDLKATLEGSKGILRPKERDLRDEKDYTNSRGAILSAIENEIYNFDLEQKRAALFIIDGAQRIRGLAGSGKTVILAMKAALIHLQFPEAKVLYTYYTKSLHDVVKNLITRFYRQFADRDPNWNKIEIMHAWGGKYLEGVYSNTCKRHNISPLNLSTARIKNPENPFDYVCEELNKCILQEEYDYSIIDEAQDFPANFYRVCRQITKRNRVIWAFDDFQNILDIDLQDEKETFGKDENGEYFIDFSRKEDQLQDLVLHKCYRNPRKILITAFALGLGVYNRDGGGGYQMIQRLENNEHWDSLGFVVKEGDSSDSCSMVIERPELNSSLIKNELLAGDFILMIKKAKDFGGELKFIVNSILEDIDKELKPEDISVVCLDNINAKKYFNYIERELELRGVESFNLLNVASNNKIYKVEKRVTLTSIYNAKGNESGKVYICGIDSVFSERNDIVERNKIFTAMTRSLAWVTMSGVGESVQHCIDEVEKLKENNFELKFVQPSEDDVKTIRQGIDTKQKLLNKIERLAEDLVKETGVSKDELVEQLKIKFFDKK